MIRVKSTKNNLRVSSGENAFSIEDIRQRINSINKTREI
jgi:Mg-chelatase subunit ChlI